MPKEFVHFHIARRTASNLGDSFLGRSARSREPALLLGSVFHDLWFYITGTRPGRLAAVADELHGKDGQDTFWLIKRQAEIVKKYRENPDSADIAEIAAALLVGMLSHLCADATFHPMVYWFSGNYYSDPRAVERHRRLETLMDLAVPADPGHFQLLRMLQATSLTNAYPCEALAELAQVPPDTLATELDATFLRFARVQRLIQLAPLAWLAHLLRPLLPRALREL
ncbi:MAG: zinc dependent phospholipase C family protein, partial [Proteobacteria bacterium]|nr:zinc dependent phospholipase C family protein [Pseudomonadota bacterium]